jgi:hypothetical protein
MEYPLLGKVLMEWSLDHREWAMALVLYQQFSVGIPNRFLYKLPRKSRFNDLSDALANNETVAVSDNSAARLFSMFKKSKWKRLDEWGGAYGYRY